MEATEVQTTVADEEEEEEEEIGEEAIVSLLNSAEEAIVVLAGNTEAALVDEAAQPSMLTEDAEPPSTSRDGERDQQPNSRWRNQANCPAHSLLLLLLTSEQHVWNCHPLGCFTVPVMRSCAVPTVLLAFFPTLYTRENFMYCSLVRIGRTLQVYHHGRRGCNLQNSRNSGHTTARCGSTLAGNGPTTRKHLWIRRCASFTKKPSRSFTSRSTTLCTHKLPSVPNCGSSRRSLCSS
mmetsp:Transcript_17521/g.52445  ORF Transcript_17521/g.52445 Transcript_17521/m.52445 type:complete len:236 (-) Transcript_17521:740-1447(-)